MTQTVKNSPAVWETWVPPLGWKIPWRRKQLPTPVFLPGEFHGQRSLAGYSPRGREESDTTEWLSLFTYVMYKWSDTAKLFCCTYISICIMSVKVVCFIGKFKAHDSLTFRKLNIRIQELPRIVRLRCVCYKLSGKGSEAGPSLEWGETLISGKTFKEATKRSVIKINNILMQYFLPSGKSCQTLQPCNF